MCILSYRYCIGSNNGGALASMSVKKFVESLGARTPSPGGGSASACIAGIGTSLATMVMDAWMENNYAFYT